MKWKINGDRPIYQQLTEQITERIVSGAFAAGTKMPSVRDLAAEAEVNPNTMQRALADLEREGLLYTQRTSGRFVTEDREMILKVRQQLAQGRIADFLSSMRLIGFSETEAVELLRKQAEKEEGEHNEHE